MDWQELTIFCVIWLAGNVDSKQAIVNGINADIKDFPYQVSIRYINEHFGGGTIISEKHILTAGHVVEPIPRSQYISIAIVTGTSHLDNRNGGSYHGIDDIHLHPDYLSEGYRALNDIAVIMLMHPIAFNSKQHKINLPKHNFKVGDKAIVTGWGYPTPHHQNFSETLKKLEMHLISTDECQTKVVDPRQTKILKTEICAIRKNESGICVGDSGGPLVVHSEVIGIVSWYNSRHCASKYPDVYANVYEHKEFIESILHHKH